MVGTRRVGPLIGVLAASVGLSAAELVAGIVPTGRSPVVAVGDAVIRLSPGSVERWAIRTLGTKDKPALVLGVLVVTLLLGAIAGRVRGSVGVAIVGAASVAGAWAALAEEDASWVHALPPLLGGVAAVVTLRSLRRAASDGRDAPLGVSAAGRRRLLLAGTAAGSVAAVAATTGRLLQGRVDASASRRAVVLPRPAEPLPLVGAGADLGVPGVPPFVTPIEDFYRIDVSLVVPQVETEGWTLRVDGLVDEPLSLTYEQLLDRPLVEADVTLVCVSNEVGGRLIGNARWLGVPLASLLSEAGVRRDRADQVVGRAVDGFTAGFPLKAALDGRDALVAVGMNGEPLPLRHGFPARLVVGGLYGYVSATKWLSSIEVTRFDAYDPYWIQRGWARMGPVKVSSRIDTPRSTVGAGPVPVGGVAWAQGRGVGRVEVRVDEDGRWHDAELGAAVGDDTWRQWRWTWPARRGRHRLTVRATTLDGEVQTRDISPPFPSGATGWHSVDVRVV